VEHWIRSVLNDLVSEQLPIDSPLQADLRRIVEIVERADPYAYRSLELAELAGALEHATSLDELSGYMCEVAVAVGFQYGTVFVLRQGSGGMFRSRICTNYPSEWVDNYDARRYQYVDPIMLRVAEQDTAFEFRHVQNRSPAVAAFWKDAAAHGVGREGVCIPVTLPCGAKFAVSFATSSTAEEAAQNVARHLSDLYVISHTLADAFGYFARITQNTPDQLSAAELRFLHMLVTCESPDALLRANANTDFSMQTAITSKLGVATIFQAIAVAATRGWFDEMPYSTSDCAFVGEALSARAQPEGSGSGGGHAGNLPASGLDPRRPEPVLRGVNAA
jgi:hypothetical protein